MSFLAYYTPRVEIKNINVLNAGKKIFDTPIKNKEEAYGKILTTILFF